MLYEVITDSSELLGTPRMAKLASELKTRYADRIVIYDMPPLLTQDDTLAFLPLVDGVRITSYNVCYTKLLRTFGRV